MGILGGLGALTKLKELLTPTNIEYLDVVLGILLTPGTGEYNAFWLCFQRKQGGDPTNKHFTMAASALQRLHAVVKEQRGTL